MKAAIKRGLVRTLPLGVRKRLAIWINRSSWLPPGDRGYWATQLLTDFAERQVNEYHKFLWTHHLAYAETYEVALRFGYDKLNASRKALFAELALRLREAGVGPPDTIHSVFEVGCSLGYLLRYIETDVFVAATELEGVDIDAQAIASGTAHLQALGSKVALHHGDMESIDSLLGRRKFDIVLGSGVLLYLTESAAQRLVGRLLEHTGKLLVITALAHPSVDNRELAASEPRVSDGTWIHNVDRMVRVNGGRVVARRWEGSRMLDGNTIYFVYAAPA
jgi:SAM-dependent methyltransferase